jgi:hypothetical protein
MGATQLLRSPSAVGRQSAPVIWAAASEHRNAVSVKPPAPAEQLADTMPFSSISLHEANGKAKAANRGGNQPSSMD